MARITRIQTQKRDPERVSIYLDGKFALGMLRRRAEEYGLVSGREITTEELHEIEGKVRRDMVLQRALGFLAIRERSTGELIRWFKKNDFQDLEESIIAYLQERDYLNDHRFAMLFARDKIRLNGWAPQRIRSELWKKSISKAMIEEVLGDLSEEYDFRGAALDLVAKRYQRLTHPGPSDKRRLWGLLQRRGYSSTVIREVLSEFDFMD